MTETRAPAGVATGAVNALTASVITATARVLTDAEQIAEAFRQNGASTAELTRVLARINERMELAEQRSADGDQTAAQEKRAAARLEREKMFYTRLLAILGVITFIVAMSKAPEPSAKVAPPPAAVTAEQPSSPLGAIERLVENWIQQFDNDDPADGQP